MAMTDDTINTMLERAKKPVNDGMSGQADTTVSAQTFVAEDPMTKTDGDDASIKSLTDLKKMFDDYRSTSAVNRQQILVENDYYDGKQITPSEAAELQKRGQPVVVVNRTRVAINGTLGVIIQSSTDPKALPTKPQDDNSASVATDCLRFVVHRGFSAGGTTDIRMESEKKACAKDYLVCGTTAMLVGIDDDKNVTFERIHWEEFFIDPRSRRVDGLDARYMGSAKWMFVDDVVGMYPDQSIDLENVTQGGSANLGASDESFEDRPINQGWIDMRNKRVMVVQIYFRERGQWYKSVFYYGGILEQGLSPYDDEKKRPTNPIQMVTAYMDRDNTRYGLIRDMRDLQDEINKRRSKLLNLVNNSQIQARDPSAIEVNVETARTEAARPDGVIPFGWQKVSTQDFAQGQSLLLTEAKNEMERFGPNPAVLGRQGADSSGRALLARQQGGLVELAVVLDQFKEWEVRIYRSAWSRIKQFWTDPMYIRVTGDEDAPSFIYVNGPPVSLDYMGQPMIDPATAPPPPPPGQPPQPPQPGDPQLQPMNLSGVLGYRNTLAEMDVDITLDVEPATATILQEQFKDLMDLVGSNPLYAQQVPFFMLIELMPGLPNKRQIVKKLQAASQQQQQKQEALQAQQQDIDTAKAHGDIADKFTKAEKNTAEAQRARSEAQAHAVNATTSANAAALEATIAHDERNIHAYETLTAPQIAKVEGDVGGGAGE